MFAIEPHLGSITATPAQTRRLLDRVPGLTITLDFSHFICKGIAQREIEPLLDRTSHFHARGAAPKRKQAPVKDNTINFRRIVRLMKRSGYRGYIAFEFEYFDADPGNEVDTLAETILLRDIVRKALAVSGRARVHVRSSRRSGGGLSWHGAGS